MTQETPRPGRLLDRPGRVAAIGGAAVVCALSLSGALGLSDSGSSADSSHHHATLADPNGAADGATSDDSATGTGTGAGTGTSDGQGAGSNPNSSGQVDQRVPPPSSDTADGQASDALPAHSGTGKRVVFDVSAQRVWLVDASGAVERSYLVSGSRFDNLDLGTYQVYSRSTDATAYNSNETMRYMVRFAQGNAAPIGFHSVPARPDGTLVEARSTLGTPQSDGCIRQWITDARALWNFAPVGTTVVVRA